jgi:hypothetical protein
VRITGGTGSGQVRRITTNTANQLTVSPAWTTTPDATSTYHILLIFYGGDHITSSITGYHYDIETDSAGGTVYIDGSYGIAQNMSANQVFNNTWANKMTFEYNLRASQGAINSWTGFSTNGGVYACSGTTTTFVGVEFKDTNSPVSINSKDGAETLIWNNCVFENVYRGVVVASTIACSTSKVFSNILGWKGPYAMNPAFCGASSNASWRYENCWFDNGSYGSMEWQINGPDIQQANDCVWNKCLITAGSGRNMASGKKAILRDNYAKQQTANAFIGNTSTTHDGSFLAYDNVMDCPLSNSAGTGSHGTLDSAYNDFGTIGNVTCASKALKGTANTNYSVAKSRWDYISSMLNASYGNTDNSVGTSSSAVPSQWDFLVTGRTTPRGSPNKPYTADNVVVGTPTDNSVVITFDCANGATASAGNSTTSGTASSGGTTIPMTELAGFLPSDWIEIDYGNAGYELIQLSASYSETTGAGNLTTATNLIITHSGSGKTVKRRQRHKGLPFIRYGIASGNYYGETDLPPVTELQEIYIGKNTTYKGQTMEFKRVGHSLTLSKLYHATTYYAQCCFITPLGDLGVSSEFSCNTAAISGLNYPIEDNVELNIGYGPSNVYTGNRRTAIVSKVESGYAYGPNDTIIGTSIIPSAAQNAAAVWNALLTSHSTSGTFGWFVKKLLTVAKFIGLK